MPKRTNLDDAKNVEHVDDLGEVVQDKRQEWGATAAKARRRQRRYTKRMTEELARLARDNDFGHDHEL